MVWSRQDDSVQEPLTGVRSSSDVLKTAHSVINSTPTTLKRSSSTSQGPERPYKRQKPSTIGLNSRFDRMMHLSSGTIDSESPSASRSKRTKSAAISEDDINSVKRGGHVGDKFRILKRGSGTTIAENGSISHKEQPSSDSATATAVPVPHWLADTFATLPSSHPLRKLAPAPVEHPASSNIKNPAPQFDVFQNPFAPLPSRAHQIPPQDFTWTQFPENSTPLLPAAPSLQMSRQCSMTPSSGSIDFNFLKDVSPSDIPFCSPGPSARSPFLLQPNPPLIFHRSGIVVSDSPFNTQVPSPVGSRTSDRCSERPPIRRSPLIVGSSSPFQPGDPIVPRFAFDSPYMDPHVSRTYFEHISRFEAPPVLPPTKPMGEVTGLMKSYLDLSSQESVHRPPTPQVSGCADAATLPTAPLEPSHPDNPHATPHDSLVYWSFSPPQTPNGHDRLGLQTIWTPHNKQDRYNEALNAFAQNLVASDTPLPEPRLSFRRSMYNPSMPSEPDVFMAEQRYPTSDFDGSTPEHSYASPGLPVLWGSEQRPSSTISSIPEESEGSVRSWNDGDSKNLAKLSKTNSEAKSSPRLKPAPFPMNSSEFL